MKYPKIVKTVYVVSDDKKLAKSIKSKLDTKGVIDYDVIQSKSIKRPSDKDLLGLWGASIIDAERNLTSNDIVVFDGNCSDKVGIHLMLGLALGHKADGICIQSSILLLNWSGLNPLDSTAPFPDASGERTLEVYYDESVANKTEDDKDYILNEGYEVLTRLCSGTYNHLIVNLDVRNLNQLVALGYAYIKGIKLTLKTSRPNPIFQNIGKLVPIN